MWSCFSCIRKPDASPSQGSRTHGLDMHIVANDSSVYEHQREQQHEHINSDRSSSNRPGASVHNITRIQLSPISSTEAIESDIWSISVLRALAVMANETQLSDSKSMKNEFDDITALCSERNFIQQRSSTVTQELMNYNNAKIEIHEVMSKHIRSLKFEQRVLKNRLSKLEALVKSKLYACVSDKLLSISSPSILNSMLGSSSELSSPLSLPLSSPETQTIITESTIDRVTSQQRVSIMSFPGSLPSPLQLYSRLSYLSENHSHICCICLQSLSAPFFVLGCGHVCHEVCSTKLSPLETERPNSQKPHSCPFCKRKARHISRRSL